MTLLDSTTHVFIWVPGTGGHAVHPAFKAAALKATKGDCQFVCVDYPASVDFIGSVKKGIKAFTKTLKAVNKARQPGQQIYVGGSSQGSWVIGDTLFNDKSLLDMTTKVVMFGDPGLSESPADFHFFYEEKVWEINNTNDAVTFGWSSEERREISKGLTDMYKFRPRGFFTLLKYMFKRPTLLWRLFVLIILHTKITDLVTSPHDYSNQMPLAIYWLMH